MTSRELMLRTIEFRNYTGRVPRAMYVLPWAQHHYPGEVAALLRDFPLDTESAPALYAEAPPSKGDPHEPGEYVDEWGCRFVNLERGIIGEVKDPMVKDADWNDVRHVHIPEEWLTFDVDAVNRFCGKSEKFITASACPRPFEQLQFIRGTAELYMDLLDMPPNMRDFLQRMHDFYCRLLTRWAKTDVDCLTFMDDWGSQNSLLISPRLWEEIFMPMYADYIAIARQHGKKIHMHSDGCILDILPRLADLGLDIVNAQLFCMDMEKLAALKGRITFWGELDRQQLLPHGTPEDIDRAVDQVYDTLWKEGGCVAECEFGLAANPANVRRMFERWARKQP